MRVTLLNLAIAHNPTSEQPQELVKELESQLPIDETFDPDAIEAFKAKISESHGIKVQ